MHLDRAWIPEQKKLSRSYQTQKKMEEVMVGILILIMSLLIVCLFVAYFAGREEMPPKAQLVCDIWKAVEAVQEDEPSKSFHSKRIEVHVH